MPDLTFAHYRESGGWPCIRGLRVRVVDVLELMATGLGEADVLEELPDLEREDIHAVLLYASKRLGHPVVAA